MDVHRGKMLRGYIGMLTVEKEYRHLGVGELGSMLLNRNEFGLKGWFTFV